MILETILAALLPVGADAFKQVVARFTGGVKPLTIDDQIKLDDSEIKRATAVAALDQPGGSPSQWVVDLRASSRYIAAWACIGIGSYFATQVTMADTGMELVSIAFGFMFGTRIVAGYKK
jgi:hypothetical protein